MRKNKKRFYIFCLILFTLFIGIGYAYLTTTLSINGTTDIDMNNWDVYFDNIQVTSGSVTGEQVINVPEVGADETSVNFHVNLKEPGDFYEFTVEARNDGTIDAMIDSVSKKLNNVEIVTLPAYLNYKVTYEDDIEIEDNHLLAHESVETYKVRVEYRNDINPSDLPTSAQSLSLSFDVEYVQADNNAFERPDPYFYTVSFNGYSLGDVVPDNITVFTSYHDAIEAYGYPIFNKFRVDENNKIIDSFVGFEIGGVVYYLRGDGASINASSGACNNDSPYYESNKSTLLGYFGNENCDDSDPEDFVCSNSNYVAHLYNNGLVQFHTDDYGCDAHCGGGFCKPSPYYSGN